MINKCCIKLRKADSNLVASIYKLIDGRLVLLRLGKILPNLIHLVGCYMYVDPSLSSGIVLNTQHSGHAPVAGGCGASVGGGVEATDH
jgi:hypothetical protein